MADTFFVDRATPITANWLNYVNDTVYGLSPSVNRTTDRVYVVVITGQSNAAGANTGGPNPANSRVKVWDGTTNSWGSSDYLQNPFARAQPDGNVGNNNIGLSFAHRLVDETGARVFVIYDAVGGRPISDWVGAGTASVRYAAIKNKVVAALASPELTAAGKTKIDFLIYAQGEEDALTHTYSDYLTSFTTLDTQFRAETWVDQNTPMFVMGMSGLHTRYQVWQAHLDYCENVNRNWIYVNSVGLKTQFDETGSGDFTHWLGVSLWYHGYYRIWNAMQDRGTSHRQGFNSLYSRGSGPWRGQPDAIALYDNLIGYSSRIGGVGVTDEYVGDGATTAFTLEVIGGSISSVTVNGVVKTSPTDYSVSGQTITFVVAPANGHAIVVTYSQTINGPAAVGSISWGYRCSADGNYTMAGGYRTSTNNLTNYSFIWGRETTFDANGDYSGGFGFQNSVTANYGLVSGRGNTVADAGGAACGQFSEYTTTQTDNVMYQVGIGTSTSVRKNGLAVRKSGIVEMKNLPVFADNAAATAGGLVAGQVYRTATGEVRIRV